MISFANIGMVNSGLRLLPSLLSSALDLHFISERKHHLCSGSYAVVSILSLFAEQV